MFNRLFRELLQEDESLDYIIHRHSLALVWPLFKSILLGLVAPALMWWLYNSDQTLVLIAMAWLFLGLLWVIYTFLDWHYDAFLLTNQHLIEIQWEGFFTRKANRIRYNNINNVSADTKGILCSLFGFADLKLMTTAGEEKTLKKAGRAKEALNLLMQRSSNDARNRAQETEQSSQADLKEALKALLKEELTPNKNTTTATPHPEKEILIMEEKEIRRKRKNGKTEERKNPRT